jgi:hypothetical protein
MGDRELFMQRDDSSLWRRHEGYHCNDLLAATLLSNREVDVFVLQTARQIFFIFLLSTGTPNNLDGTISFNGVEWCHTLLTMATTPGCAGFQTARLLRSTVIRSTVAMHLCHGHTQDSTSARLHAA